MPTTPLPNLKDLVACIVKGLSACQPSSIDRDALGNYLALDNSLSRLNRVDGRTAKQLLTTLHFLFPHEMLPALDLLDRRLVNHLIVSPAGSGDEETSTDAEPLHTATNEVFYVQSASAVTTSSKSKSRRRAYNPNGTHYEVRLKAWNCSCPAFASSAFSRQSYLATNRDRDNHGEVETNQAPPTEHDRNLPDLELASTAQPFGGSLVLEGTGTPVCKHILAAFLGSEVPGLFGHGIVRRHVSKEEAAGWAGGWGD